MSEQKSYWEDIFSRYQASGLSQPAFCRQNNISHNQFNYRWYERNKALKKHQPQEQFESVAVVSNRALPAMIMAIKIEIHLPNKIRCDVTVDAAGLAPLLTQLVQLC